MLAAGRGFVGKQIARFELVAEAAYEVVGAVGGVGERVVVLHRGARSLQWGRYVEEDLQRREEGGALLWDVYGGEGDSFYALAGVVWKIWLHLCAGFSYILAL